MTLDPSIQQISGSLIASPGARFAIVASRFNSFIVEQLVAGAIDGFVRHGIHTKDLTVVHVPGARELGPVCERLAASTKFSAIVACGVVIRGATAHFDYVAGDASNATAAAALKTGTPVIFGVLTTDTIEQAVERAGTKAGNKGFDAALAAIEMASLNRALAEAGL